MIGERRSAILGLIIDHYIKTGEPIGSKTMCQLLPYPVSSATIRNEMAYLSNIGFLEQRHTSGGRVPTKASYRYYVDNLMPARKLSIYEQQRIDEVLSVNASDPERLLADAANLLADTTGCTAFYSTVRDPYDCVQGVELIPVGDNKAMLVVLSVGGKIRSSLCKLNCPVDNNFKALFYKISQEYFVGVPLVDIDLSLIQSTAPALGAKIFDMLPILSSLCSLCKEAAAGTLAITGETNLLSQEELGTSVYNLLTLLAEKKKLELLLTEFAKTNIETKLLLGEENPVYELRNTSMAIAKFIYNNNQVATLGIIGSLRIDYSSILPRVDYIINTVSTYLKEGGIKYE
ncbi:MAG: heat-inducible transcriptional repressor HrcA [Eubacterium sp.]